MNNNRFFVAISCGYNSSSSELCGSGVEIINSKYEKEVYVKLEKLIQEYYLIKSMQQTYKNSTKRERIERDKKLNDDKKRLDTISNNIVYGYSDLFLEYYNWCRPLCRHYIKESKKDVLIGPSLIKVKKINRTINDNL